MTRTRIRKTWRIGAKVWRGLNWKRTAGEIASELRVTPQAVYQAAARYGKAGELLPGVRDARCKLDWASVPDNSWSKTNADLARELGVSREIVRRKRQKFAPPGFEVSPGKGV